MAMYRDIYGAQRARIKTVFFRSNQGAQEKDDVKPDYIIYNFPELLNAIRRNTAKPCLDLRRPCLNCQ